MLKGSQEQLKVLFPVVRGDDRTDRARPPAATISMCARRRSPGYARKVDDRR
jgi:hypothetical protein